MFKRRIVQLLGLTACFLASPIAHAESVLRLAMTLNDIPLTTGQPSQGGEGIRATGTTLYDALLRWEISEPGQPARVVPGLAQSWSIDSSKTVWTLNLRHGVLFHDGSEFTADDVIWNFDKLLRPNSPQYDKAQAAQGASYIASLKNYRKIDDFTVELQTREPDSALPYRLVQVYMSSRRRFAEVGNDWGKFAEHPSGTGPFKLDKLVPRSRLELTRNNDYWDKGRIPKVQRVVMLTMPDANTRVAALLSGEVDVVEAVPPDTIPRLKQSGMQIVSSSSPNILHVWPYWLSYAEKSPFRDIRVRKAANLAIDRDGMTAMLGGFALPATGMVTADHPWYGHPTFKIGYRPDEARALMAEAGYGPGNPAKVTFIISPSGSGQMQPLPMNEFVQENLKEVGIDISFEVMDWEALRSRRRLGADAPENLGIHALNNSWNIADPDMGLLSTSASTMRPPQGNNWGLFSDREVDELVARVKLAFDPKEQDAALAALHAHIVDQAMWIWVVHDLAPRALSPKVKGFVPGHNAYQDLTSISMD